MSMTIQQLRWLYQQGLIDLTDDKLLVMTRPVRDGLGRIVERVPLTQDEARSVLAELGCECES